MTSEKGHDVNVANLQILINVCIALGATYNPSRPSIQLAQLNALFTAAQAALNAVITASVPYVHAVNGRIADYGGLKQLCTRLVNALDATDATDLLVADVRTINRRLQGARKGTVGDAPLEEGGELPTENQISVSQQSFVKRLENFRELWELVASEASYSPNEADLQAATITARLTAMETANNTVSVAAIDLSNARIARNHLLYDKPDGMLSIVADVKKYIKSIFGASSPEYKQVSAIKFTYIR